MVRFDEKRGRTVLKINDDQIKQYESDLKTFAGRSLPFATKQTINRAAFETRRRAQDNIREGMTTRNKYTVSSVRVQQARGLDIRKQEAITGSIADYLATQEFGGTETGGGRNQPIATSYAAGQGRGAKRTRLPRKPNKMQAIRLRKKSGAGLSRKAQNAAAVQGAAQGGNKFVFMDLGRRQGIFRVTGGKRKPKIQMVWDLSRRSVRIPRNPWLAPATNETQRHIPQYYSDALRFQLKRHRVLGYR
jgi:hypothetical protein